MTDELIKNTLSLSSTCQYMAIASFVAAVISTIVAWLTAPKDTVDDAMQTVKAMAVHPNLAPAPADIPKVIDAVKGLIDSLSKASPLVAWLGAAVFFMTIAVFSVSDYAHSPSPQTENHGTSHK